MQLLLIIMQSSPQEKINLETKNFVVEIKKMIAKLIRYQIEDYFKK